MTDKIMFVVLVYLIVAFGLGVLIGKLIKWGQAGRKWK
jgi:hypothetical protein